MHAVLEDVAERISRYLNGLDTETTQIRSDGKAHSRSIQQVVEDLVQSYRFTAQSLETRLNKGRVTRNQNRSRLQWLLQIMILGFGHIPEGVELPNEASSTPLRFSPMDGSDLARLLWEELEAMDVLLDRCRRKFGMERVAVHPLLGPLRVDQWRRLHAVYTWHCLKRLRGERQTVAGSARKVKLAKELHIPAQ